MKTKKMFLTMCAVMFSVILIAQNEWEPRVHVTGYVNAVAEYTDVKTNFEEGKHLNKEYAVGLSEFGFLATYKPLEKLEFKTTMVYSHFTFHVSQLFVEGYSRYSFNDALKVTAGRFLTPLSPVNLYFYAPLNPSGVVPMLVSHHFMFPQSISGLQLSGEIEAASALKLGYNLSAGTYAYINHMEAGVLGILSQEDAYPSFGYYDTEADKINNYMCATARVYGVINDMVTIGANYFTGDAQQVTQDANSNFVYHPSTKYTYGFDLHVNVANVKFNAEYWGGEQETVDPIPGEGHVKNSYVGYYGEVIYDGDVFKPFVRYDFIEDVNVHSNPLPASATTFGIAVRPIYETLIKFEYKRYNTKQLVDIHAAGGPDNWVFSDYSYNYLQLSFVLSF